MSSYTQNFSWDQM